jgi:hypothetical protein
VNSAPTSGRLDDGSHVLPLRVYYEDTDAAGIVYYATGRRLHGRRRSACPIAAARADCPGPGSAERIAPLTPYSDTTLLNQRRT